MISQENFIVPTLLPHKHMLFKFLLTIVHRESAETGKQDSDVRIVILKEFIRNAIN